MLGVFFDVLFQVFADSSTQGRSPGPPVDLGSAMVVAGVAASVGAPILFFASTQYHVLSVVLLGSGLISTVMGIRLAGRR